MVGMHTPRWNRRLIPGAMRLNQANPFVFVGDVSGSRAHAKRPGSLCAPIDVDPNCWRWPLQDMEVTVVCEPGSRAFANQLALCILADGAKLVVVCDKESYPTFYQRTENGKEE